MVGFHNHFGYVEAGHLNEATQSLTKRSSPSNHNCNEAWATSPKGGKSNPEPSVVRGRHVSEEAGQGTTGSPGDAPKIVSRSQFQNDTLVVGQVEKKPPPVMHVIENAN
ncbi:hypothetical protein PoB_003132100 [Plakobranchus ocellatus]|uniref:Uncharacterized protein n=1 Tax=Plakobranchus ocellatus TaxID=259542 RepID=A0AAV4ADU3_9GAST|nr:hypothetical protein PoB_003132100 [Plakobranchus ocellatus]